MPCVACREVVVGAVCATVHATDDYLRWASSHCAKTPATANGDLAQPQGPGPTQTGTACKMWYACLVHSLSLPFPTATTPSLHFAFAIRVQHYSSIFYPRPLQSIMWSESSHGALPSSTTDRNSNRRNILIVGEGYVGKSSLINLITGGNQAFTSSVHPATRTLHSQEYIVTLEGVEFALYDTASLEGLPGVEKADYLDAIHQTYELISTLERSGGISLLIFCMKGERISITATQTYNLFVEVLCSRPVPVAIVVTHLEILDNMEEWWRQNQGVIQEYGLRSVGHACITTTRGLDNMFGVKYELSREIIHKLLLDYHDSDSLVAWKEENTSWVGRVGMRMGAWLLSPSPRGVKQLKEKLVKRCGFSVEDAEAVSSRVEKLRRISWATLRDKNKSLLAERISEESKEISGDTPAANEERPIDKNGATKESQETSGDTPAANEERSIDKNGATEESRQKISSDGPEYSENPWFDERFGFDSSNCISLPIISYTS